MRKYEKFSVFGHVASEDPVRGDAVGFDLGHELEGVVGCPNHLPVENSDPLIGILSEKLRIVSFVVFNISTMFFYSNL